MDNHAGDGTSDDFFDQILGFPPYTGAVPNLAGNESSSSPEMLQLSSGGSGGFEFPLGSMNASGSVRTFSDHVVDTRLSSTIKSVSILLHHNIHVSVFFLLLVFVYYVFFKKKNFPLVKHTPPLSLSLTILEPG